MTTETDAPLPGAPNPWAPSSMPPWRDGPPYLMTEMIAAEPALAERLLRRVAADPAVERLAEEVRGAATARRTITFTGCGTSEHAAMASAEIVEEALAAAGLPAHCHALDALEFTRRPTASGLVVAISHEGGTAATNEALGAAAAAGAATALITVSRRSPGAAPAEIVVETGEQDQSWCHTVGYLSPLVAATVLGARIAALQLEPVAIRALVDGGDGAQGAERVAEALAGCDRILLAGSGIDYVSARELALKIEEGARLPAVAHPIETVRHGHLAAATARTGLVVVATTPSPEDVRRRARDVLASAGILGMPAAALLGASLADEVPLALTPAGRLWVAETRHVMPVAASAIGAAVPLQLLAERLSRARGVNPDTLGREDPKQAAAAEAEAGSIDRADPPG